MNGILGVTIIVVNYNNGNFLSAAIDSALAQDHVLCEVVVVDDCSTDNSLEIINSYGERIRSVVRDTNGHQIVAINSAWPIAAYPILIFLDSDDVLSSRAAAAVAQRWTEKTVKAQFLLASIDETGYPLDHIFPKYPQTINTAIIRAQLLNTAQSPSSPASGNAYSRRLLEKITEDGGFELENPREYWMDNILECNAPFYGEVVTIHEPLAYYRIHDGNHTLQKTIDHKRFEHACEKFLLKANYLEERCRFWGIPFDRAAACNGSLWLLECRLAAAKLAPDPAVTRVGTLGSLWRALRACTQAPLGLPRRVIFAAWCVGVVVTPRAAARRIIALRFVVTQRPRWLERLFRKRSIAR